MGDQTAIDRVWWVAAASNPSKPLSNHYTNKGLAELTRSHLEQSIGKPMVLVELRLDDEDREYDSSNPESTAATLLRHLDLDPDQAPQLADEARKAIDSHQINWRKGE